MKRTPYVALFDIRGPFIVICLLRWKKGRELLIHRSAVPLLQQEKARAENESRYEDERTAGEGALRVVGAPTPTGENNRCIDDKRLSKKSRGRKVGGRGYALLIHRSAVPLSRCGSGTLGLFHSTGVKFSPLVPLRYRQEKARTGGVQICLLRWEKVAAED